MADPVWQSLHRRDFLSATVRAAACGGILGPAAGHVAGLPSDMPVAGERPLQEPSATVLNPCGDRVPVSFVIDDSTCLVNMAHFAMPQFAQAWPQRDSYEKDWRSWPREIPDSFVRKFGEWCHEQGVKGKYSIVPYPSCVGWVDRFLPGWSKGELEASLDLVRDLMMPDWDIHPEMISHTRVIDLKTGRPLPPKSDGSFWMENGGWTAGRSVDEISAYIAHALQVLKNVGLPCEGFTTPGGFGNPAKANLVDAGREALIDVFSTAVPHYFKYVTSGNESNAPRVEQVSGLGTGDPRFMVNVPSCTGDWFGGWDGVTIGEVGPSIDRLVSEDAKSGRLPEVIARGEPAVFLCHWPGLYCNGGEEGWQIFQGAVERLNAALSDRITWMKMSEIARYWAAKELTAIQRGDRSEILFDAPVAAPDFTLRIGVEPAKVTEVTLSPSSGKPTGMNRLDMEKRLEKNSWQQQGKNLQVRFDLPNGVCRLKLHVG